MNENEECPNNHENAYLVLVDEDGAHYECHECGYTWCDADNAIDDSEE